jgi:hypothetical protein
MKVAHDDRVAILLCDLIEERPWIVIVDETPCFTGMQCIERAEDRSVLEAFGDAERYDRIG